MHPIESTRVVIKGAGDLATGVALRLHRCGFAVIMTELARPLAVRRTVSFAQAVFDGATQVEGAIARACAPQEAEVVLATGAIPILVTPTTAELAALRPAVLVDAIMAKRNTGTTLDDAPLVVALGPGFTVGTDCHAVIETNRGHNLGRVIWRGSAEPDTGVEGAICVAAYQTKPATEQSGFSRSAKLHAILRTAKSAFMKLLSGVICVPGATGSASSTCRRVGSKVKRTSAA